MGGIGLGLSPAIAKSGSGGGIKTGLVEFWAMDGTSGNEVGLHAGLTLTAYNAPSYGAGPIYANARECLEASSQYFECTSQDLNLTGSLTVASWFLVTTWPTSSPLDYHWFACNGGSQWNGGYGMRLNQAHGIVSDLYAKANGYSQIHYSASYTNALNTWFLVMQWYDADADSHGVQVDANAASTESWAYGCASANYAFTVGRKPSGDLNYYDGRFGPIMVWSRALSAEERSWLYNDGSGREYADL